MKTAQIYLKNESALLGKLSGKTFNDEKEFCNTVTDYIDEQKIDTAIKSPEINSKFRVLSSLLSQGN